MSIDYQLSKSNALIISILAFRVGKHLIPIYLYLYLNTNLAPFCLIGCDSQRQI